MRCLDFGAGDGRHTKFLLEKSHEVFATDTSIFAAKLTKKNIPGFKNFIIILNDDYSKIEKSKLSSLETYILTQVYDFY
jgi:methylase of polypeptide subunit release factors